MDGIVSKKRMLKNEKCVLILRKLYLLTNGKEKLKKMRMTIKKDLWTKMASHLHKKKTHLRTNKSNIPFMNSSTQLAYIINGAQHNCCPCGSVVCRPLLQRHRVDVDPGTIVALAPFIVPKEIEVHFWRENHWQIFLWKFSKYDKIAEKCRSFKAQFILAFQ